MEYYPAIKRNTFESVLKRLMNLEPIIQSEVSQRKTNIIYQPLPMESRTRVLMNLFAGQEERYRCGEQTELGKERVG